MATGTTDPLTGVVSGDDTLTPDYLGQLAPLLLKSQPALPVTGPTPTGAGPTGITGPAGATTATTGGATAPGAPLRVTQAGGGGTTQPTGISNLDRVMAGLTAGGKIADIAGSLFGTDAVKRGDTGGVSLSDQVRSALASGELPAGLTFPTPGPAFAQEVAAGAVSPSDVFNPAFVGSGPPSAGAAIPGDLTTVGGAAQGALEGPGAAAAGAGASATEAVSQALPYVGALLSAGFSLNDIVSGNIPNSDKAALAAHTAVRAVADIFGMGIPSLVDTVIQMLGGPSGSQFFSDVFGLGSPHYNRVREHASGVATDALNRLVNDISASSVSIEDTRKTLGQSYADGHIFTDFHLPAALAQQIGIPVPPGYEALGYMSVNPQAMTPDQFNQMLDAYIKDPNSITLIGSGDVPYLSQDAAQGVADQAVAASRAALDHAAKLRQLERLNQMMQGSATSGPTAAPTVSPAAPTPTPETPAAPAPAPGAPTAQTSAGGGGTLGSPLTDQQAQGVMAGL